MPAGTQRVTSPSTGCPYEQDPPQRTPPETFALATVSATRAHPANVLPRAPVARAAAVRWGESEVRKLAEEAQAAAHEISTLIGAIQAETNHAVDVVEAGAKRTEEGAGVVEETREAFTRIGSAVDDMATRIEQIAAASQQIAAGAQSMQENIAEVAAVAEQSSASTEQVSAATQQTSASAEQIAATAQELSGNAEALNELVAKFKLTT